MLCRSSLGQIYQLESINVVGKGVHKL